LEKELGEKVKECESLKKTIQAKDKDIAKVNEALEGSKKELISQVEEKLPQLEKELEILNNKLVEKEDMISKLNNTKDKECKYLGDKNSELNKTLNSLKEQLNEKENIITKMKYTHKDLIEENSKLKTEAMELNNKIRQLQFDLEGSRAKYQALQSNYSDLRYNKHTDTVTLINIIEIQ